MDFEALAGLGWREGLMAIIALLALYVVVAFLRIRRLKRDAPLAGRVAAHSAAAAYAAMQEPALSEGSAAVDSPEAPEAPEPPAQPPFAWNEPPPVAAGQFESLEREIMQLRKEVGGLRAEVLLLREEQRRELAQAGAAQNVSPVYSEAMQMAMRGHDAASIAQHCGIARAEAELVVALVRNQDARDS